MNIFKMNFNKRIVFTLITIILILIPILGVHPSWSLFLFLFFIYLAIANMWNLLAGYSGLVSLCQPAFIGIGAYTMTLLAWFGIPLYLGIIAAMLVSGLFAIFISIPVFRTKGIYFSIGTLIVPEVLRLLFLIWNPVGGLMVGGGAGFTVKGSIGFSANQTYWLALFICLLSLFSINKVLKSNLGFGLAAIRDNERSAASSGVDVFKLKLFSFVLSAMVTSLAGAVFYIFQGYVDPSTCYSIRWTIALILATVLGGIGTQEGPIIGSVIVVLLHFLLAKYAGISLLLQGIILVAIMLIAPNGIAGFLRRFASYRNFINNISSTGYYRKIKLI